MLRIGELAKTADCLVQTVRFYESGHQHAIGIPIADGISPVRSGIGIADRENTPVRDRDMGRYWMELIHGDDLSGGERFRHLLGRYPSPCRGRRQEAFACTNASVP